MTLLEAALEYAEAGIAIFPLADKEKHPRPGTHGVKEATTDIEQIKKWWAKWPNANIGIALGEKYGKFALDDDTGTPEFIKSLPHTVITVTPNQHYHPYFKMPEEGIKNGLEIKDKVTIRSTGYYVVGAPSIHPKTGTPYGF